MRKLALLVVSLFLFGCAVPLASADDDSLKVVVLLEDKQYSVGSVVKVTVHVFDKAKHVDADSVPNVVTGMYPTRAVSVSRTSTGIYEGTFTLQSSDLSGGYGMVSAAATYGKADANDTTYNEATGSAMISTGASTSVGLSVQCLVKSISTNIAKPGTQITVEAVVTHNGTAVVPSDFSIGLSYEERGGKSHQENMTTTNPAVGTYECVYSVPELTFDTDLEFEAEADYAQNTDSDVASVSLDFFQVIYHNISKKATEAVFDLFIADLSGKPVGGAALSVTCRPDGLTSKSQTLDAGVTDSSGKARVTLSCDNGTGELDVNGYANASGKSQSFSGTITIPSGPESAPSPSGNDFEAVYVGKDTVYKAGQTISRDFVLFNNSKLWANKEVYCYIQSGKLSTTTFSYLVTSVDAKTLTSDADGRLRLTVPAPANQETLFDVDFVTATGIHEKPSGWGSDHDSVDGQFYSEDSDSFMSQKSALAGALKVSVKKLNIGSPTEVSAEAQSGDPPMAQVGWFPGEIEDIYQMITQDLDWNIWSQTASYMAKKGSSYSGTVTIPSFMPKDKKYSIVVLKEGADISPEYYGIATVSPGQSSAPVASEIPWLAIGAAIAVLVVVAAAAFILLRKKRTVEPTAFGHQQAPYPQAPAYQQPAPVTAPPGPPAPGSMATPPAGYQQPPPVVSATAPPQPVYTPPPFPPAAAPPQATAIPPPSPIPPPAPSVTGPVAMPNNAFCAFCNQWILQGAPGILCSCGKYYHESCAKIQLQCSNCGKVL
jgi:hypothetical protein